MRSEPDDFAVRFGVTGRSSTPSASRRSQSVRLPTARCSTWGSAVRTSTSRTIPSARSRFAVTGPTPHSASTGRRCRNASTRSAGMTVRPSGLSQSEAIFAKNLLGAAPAETVSSTSSRIHCFSRRATVVASGSSQRLRVTSRYASSSESGSTSGVTERYMSKMRFDISRYRPKSGGTTTRSEHRRTARAIGIAERTPNCRAS